MRTAEQEQAYRSAIADLSAAKRDANLLFEELEELEKKANAMLVVPLDMQAKMIQLQDAHRRATIAVSQARARVAVMR